MTTPSRSSTGGDLSRRRRSDNNERRSRKSFNRHDHVFNGTPISSHILLNESTNKVGSRSRLYIGNLPTNVTAEEVKMLFEPFGKVLECYLSGKGFAFVKLDTFANAQSAKEALNMKTVKGRQIRVLVALHCAAIRVKELSPHVSNELLYHTFTQFGEVERAVHVLDDKGKPTGEGIVEFARKPSMIEALAQIRNGIFFLTSSLKPIIAEPLEQRNEDDGVHERNICHMADYSEERRVGPYFALPGTFEYVIGAKWKQLYENETQRRHLLEEELKAERMKLMQNIEHEREDYRAQTLREELQLRQMELERMEVARRERLAANGGGPAPNFAPASFKGNLKMPNLTNPPALMQIPFAEGNWNLTGQPNGGFPNDNRMFSQESQQGNWLNSNGPHGDNPIHRSRNETFNAPPPVKRGRN